MSLILDALHKADKDRNGNQELSGLESENATTPPSRGENTRLLWAAGGLTLLLICIATGLYLWLSRDAEQPDPTPKVATVPSQNAHAERPEPPATPPEVKRPPLAKAPAQQHSVQAQKAIDAQYARAAGDENSQERVKPEVQALYRQTPEPEPTPLPTPPPTPVPTRVAAATPAPTPTPKPSAPSEPVYPKLADFKELGSIRSLPWTLQEQIPTLNYSEHRFVDLQDAEVVINGETHKKGDRVEKDLVIELIVEDGILLKYQNNVFKMPALNSWINM